MARQDKIGKTATKVHVDRLDNTHVTYHETTVVCFSETKIILRSDGYETVTTKTRMNQASAQFGLGYHVYQVDYTWFVDYNDETLPFVDGMSLTR